MWIGQKKIKGTLDMPNEQIKVGFKDNSPDIIINKNLFDIIQSEDQNKNGNVTDVVGHVLATKILMELANYGLEYYMVDTITARIQTLLHNLREEKIGAKFGCKSPLDIKISQILDLYGEEK